MKRFFLLLAVLFLLTTSFSCNKSNPDKTTDTDIEIITLYVNSELGVYNDGESGLQLDAMQRSILHIQGMNWRLERIKFPFASLFTSSYKRQLL